MRLYSVMVLSVLTLLSSCSFAPIRIGVADITLPGNSSMGQVCYVRVSESSRVGFRNATYRATATYTSDTLAGSDDVTIRVYGRETEPAETCASTSDADTALSDPLTLSPDEPQEVEIGGSTYGRDLADLIVKDTYWLGVALTGGTLLSLEERIALTGGVISVYF